MKIPVKIYDTILSALVLQQQHDLDAFCHDLRIRNAKYNNVEKALIWINKHKRKRKKNPHI